MVILVVGILKIWIYNAEMIFGILVSFLGLGINTIYTETLDLGKSIEWDMIHMDGVMYLGASVENFIE